MIVPVDRHTLRRKSVPAFIRKMSGRHPELSRPVTYDDFLAMAARDGIHVMLVRLSRPGRLLRIGSHSFIQLDKRRSRGERAVAGMHELSHFWRDDPGEPCYNYEDEALYSDAEEFADIFAWVVTSPARVFLPGLAREDLPANSAPGPSSFSAEAL